MEQKQINLEMIYKAIQDLRREMHQQQASQTQFQMDDEGELTDEFKAKLEKRRKSNSYISHEEVKRQILAKSF